MGSPVRPIAFYLPQYHPTPENDAWWGRGFTDWTNVAKARPLFPGHAQPRLPADLGFYDLRLPEVRLAQAELAQRYGIYGFAYYHYWFNGRRLLHRPLDEVLDSREPRMPFCLCWANENWTRAWDGHEKEVLIQQTYDPHDDRLHLRWLAKAFRDDRYIRIDGRPLFLVYRISRLPDPLRTATIWREEAAALGLGELYLCIVESLGDDRRDPTRIGFDAAVEFQPDWITLPPPRFLATGAHTVYSYADLIDQASGKAQPAHRRFPCVTTGWDNSPRRREGSTIFTGSTPALYQQWLERVISRFRPFGTSEDLIFINAWNEWAEGAVLEPCQAWGHGYLEATQRALQAIPPPERIPRSTGSRRSPGNENAVRVSVCIPTYNGSKYVHEAVTSVLNQTLADLELIVVDDASTDATADIVRSFRDSRLRLFRNRARLGLVGNWNRCIELATAPYVSLFHQDDVMARDNLARKIAFLAQHPSVGFVHSNVRQIGPSGESISDWWYFKPEPADEGLHVGRDYFQRLVLGLNIVCCPSVVARLECYHRAGPFSAALPFTADWEMWMRLALFYDVGYLVAPLVAYRRHHAAETNRFSGARDLEQGYRAKMLVLNRHADRIPDVTALRLEVARSCGVQALEQACLAYRSGHHEQARRYLALSVEIRQSDARPTDAQEDWFLATLHRFGDWQMTRESDDDHVKVSLATRGELEVALRQATAEITALRNSMSWTVTAPLRWLYGRVAQRPLPRRPRGG